jgi:hypothetical protein
MCLTEGASGICRIGINFFACMKPLMWSFETARRSSTRIIFGPKGLLFSVNGSIAISSFDIAKGDESGEYQSSTHYETSWNTFEEILSDGSWLKACRWQY